MQLGDIQKDIYNVSTEVVLGKVDISYGFDKSVEESGKNVGKGGKGGGGG